AATPVGRLAPRGNALADGFEHDVLADVVMRALAEARITPRDVGSLVFTQAPPTTRQLGFATFVAARLGMRPTAQLAEVQQMGITGGLAFSQAAADVQLGRAEYALALGVAIQSGADSAAAMDHSVRVVGDVDFQSPFGITPIAWYALDAARYMHETGASRADIAHVALKSRAFAAMNPLAQFREPLTIADVLAQPMVVEPLGRLEVPARADGAICLVLCSEERARASGLAAAVVGGRGFGSDGFHQMGDVIHDITAFPAARVAADRALDEAGIQLGDLDVAELYAPCTITEVLVSEALGFFARGEGAIAAREGRTGPGGAVPINTSGGCLARGHPPSLTALYDLLELREQLLGRAGERQVPGARRALAICELGNYNAALAHVLESAP
ncbi:MAG: thiolase family protein, partial [Nevskiaceae bacterium]